MDSLFQADTLRASTSSGASFPAGSDLAELSKHTGEFEGFQFLELRSTLPDELSDVRGQAVDGARSRSARSLSGREVLSTSNDCQQA